MFAAGPSFLPCLHACARSEGMKEGGGSLIWQQREKRRLLGSGAGSASGWKGGGDGG